MAFGNIRSRGRKKPDTQAEGDEESSNAKRRPSITAEDRIVRLLAKRDHSEAELRQKLAVHHSEDEISEALEIARANKWLAEPVDIAERAARALGRKKKGHRFINQFLKAKGLPPVAMDSDEELRKGLELVRSKLAKDGPFDYEEIRKIQRLLANRGFDSDTIRRVVAEARKTPST